MPVLDSQRRAATLSPHSQTYPAHAYDGYCGSSSTPIISTNFRSNFSVQRKHERLEGSLRNFSRAAACESAWSLSSPLSLRNQAPRTQRHQSRSIRRFLALLEWDHQAFIDFPSRIPARIAHIRQYLTTISPSQSQLPTKNGGLPLSDYKDEYLSMLNCAFSRAEIKMGV